MSTSLIEASHVSVEERPVRFGILGLPVDAIGMKQALAEVDRQIRTADYPSYIMAGNPEKVYAVRGSSFLRDFFLNAALVVPDGIGVVIAMRWLYGQKIERVAGADLMQAICAAAPERGYRIFIYGAAEEVNSSAVHELQRRYPGIQIVGRANGYVKEADMPALIEQINNSHADILFVGLGTPRQEEWLNRWLPDLKVQICQCIGGTLDTVAGRVKRAPQRWQRLGLEWLYRLLHEPSRAGRQAKLIGFAWELFLKR